MELRIGHGMDIHQFEEGRKLMLGGISIPFEKGLKGHSDADALLHALVDALLGATGRPDIGSLFPDTDPMWKDASSSVFLSSVWDELKSEGWAIQNIDCTVLAQVPKIAPYVEEMKKHIASTLSLRPDLVGIKASTTEKLGFVGREEGLLASVMVLLLRDEDRLS